MVRALMKQHRAWGVSRRRREWSHIGPIRFMENDQTAANECPHSHLRRRQTGTSERRVHMTTVFGDVRFRG
jgi:hypothetical protein